MKPSRPATAPVRPRDPAATRPSTALDAAQKTARWAKLSRELAPLVRPKTASGTRQTFGLADALQLKAQLAVVEREFEGVLAQASAGGERRKFRPSSASPGRRSRSPPRPFTSFTPPAHGAVDGALPNSADSDDASLEPFMRDFVQEWRASFDREKASYKSFVVFMEMKLRQGLHLGLGQEQNEVVTYQRITSHVRGALKLRGPRSAVAHATDLINALLEPEPDDRLGARAGGLAELQAHPFFDGVDWAALAAGTAPSPLAALASHQLNELLPDGGDGQPNPELGIETEPCPAELLSADGEAERFDGLS